MGPRTLGRATWKQWRKHLFCTHTKSEDELGNRHATISVSPGHHPSCSGTILRWFLPFTEPNLAQPERRVIEPRQHEPGRWSQHGTTTQGSVRIENVRGIWEWFPLRAIQDGFPNLLAFQMRTTWHQFQTFAVNCENGFPVSHIGTLSKQFPNFFDIWNLVVIYPPKALFDTNKRTWGSSGFQTPRASPTAMDNFCRLTLFSDVNAIYSLTGSIPKITSVSYAILLFFTSGSYVSRALTHVRQIASACKNCPVSCLTTPQFSYDTGSLQPLRLLYGVCQRVCGKRHVFMYQWWSVYLARASLRGPDHSARAIRK